MYISKFNKPAYLLDTIDRIACEFGVPTLTEQLEADRAAAASTVSGILTATAVTSTINRVIANIATVASVPMDELSDDTFCYVIADDNPIEFEDPEKFAFRFGAGYIVVTRSTCAFDVRHDCIDAQTTPLDLIVLACAMKMSQRDCYVLLRRCGRYGGGTRSREKAVHARPRNAVQRVPATGCKDGAASGSIALGRPHACISRR